MNVDSAMSAWDRHRFQEWSEEVEGYEDFHRGVPYGAGRGRWGTGWRIAQSGAPHPNEWSPSNRPRALCLGVFQAPSSIDKDDSIAGDLEWACPVCSWRIALWNSDTRSYFQPPPYVPIHDHPTGRNRDMRRVSPIGGKSIEAFMEAFNGAERKDG